MINPDSGHGYEIRDHLIARWFASDMPEEKRRITWALRKWSGLDMIMRQIFRGIEDKFDTFINLFHACL